MKVLANQFYKILSDSLTIPNLKNEHKSLNKLDNGKLFLKGSIKMRNLYGFGILSTFKCILQKLNVYYYTKYIAEYRRNTCKETETKKK